MDIFSMARSGRTEDLKKLMKTDVDINRKNEKGHSPLMLACYGGHFEAAQFLISCGADVNSVDNDSNSILMGVAFKGHSAIFDLLIQSGADPEHANAKNQSVMDLAVMFGRRELIFKINRILNSERSSGKMELLKTWMQKGI